MNRWVLRLMAVGALLSPALFFVSVFVGVRLHDWRVAWAIQAASFVIYGYVCSGLRAAAKARASA